MSLIYTLSSQLQEMFTSKHEALKTLVHEMGFSDQDRVNHLLNRPLEVIQEEDKSVENHTEESEQPFDKERVSTASRQRAKLEIA